MSIAYGYDVSDGETDHFIQLAEMGLEEFSIAANPGAFLVDVLPWRTSLTRLIKPCSPYCFVQSEIYPCESARDVISEKSGAVAGASVSNGQ